MAAPHVLVGPAADQVPTQIEKPAIAESSGAAFTEWSASQSGDAVLLEGCVATPIPGWVEDMRPVVEARTVGLTGAAAAKLLHTSVDVRPGKDNVFDLRSASDIAGPVMGHARTFVGFDDARVFTCFAICASPSAASHPLREEAACDQAIVDARLVGTSAPPPPGLALRSATWAVHHPRPAAFAGGVLIVVAAALAVVFRRRPRSTITR